MVRAEGMMLMVSPLEAVAGGMELSVTWIKKSNIPTVVGVPVMTPALESDRPGGSNPKDTDQNKGGVPAVAVNVCCG
jgi:hypothetical protein